MTTPGLWPTHRQITPEFSLLFPILNSSLPVNASSKIGGDGFHKECGTCGWSVRNPACSKYLLEGEALALISHMHLRITLK